MQNYNKIYLPYVPPADVNYIYIFYLYKKAQRMADRDIKQDIGYKSINDLCRQLNEDQKVISYSTLKRMIESKKYEDFFSIRDCGNIKWLSLNNDFRSKTDNKQRFVVLNPTTYNLLIQQEDNLLAKYTIYIKYMCGLNGGESDFTANQFLSAFGYCTKSGSEKGQLSKYNHLLEENQIISIDRTMLEEGKRRNTYTFLDT